MVTPPDLRIPLVTAPALSVSEGEAERIAMSASHSHDGRPQSEPLPPTPAERRLLELIYDAFARLGEWPMFQYVAPQLWREGAEPRDLFFRLSERGFLLPSFKRREASQLREETKVSITLLGLTYLPAAADDIRNFVAAVRYIAQRADNFRPTSPTELERLTITSEEVRLELQLQIGDPAILRQGALISNEAWMLSSSFGSQRDGSWNMTVLPERARHFRDIHTVLDFIELSTDERVFV